MTKLSAKREQQDGFSMISVLVAVILLGVGIMGLSSAGMVVMGSHTEASVRSTATAIAVGYMEQVKQRPTLASESAVAVDETGQTNGNGKFQRSLTVADEPNVVKSKRVTIEVKYPSGWGRVSSVKLTTIIYQG